MRFGESTFPFHNKIFTLVSLLYLVVLTPLVQKLSCKAVLDNYTMDIQVCAVSGRHYYMKTHFLSNCVQLCFLKQLLTSLWAPLIDLAPLYLINPGSCWGRWQTESMTEPFNFHLDSFHFGPLRLTPPSPGTQMKYDHGFQSHWGRGKINWNALALQPCILFFKILNWTA